MGGFKLMRPPTARHMELLANQDRRHAMTVGQGSREGRHAMAETTTKKQRGRPFKKGQSGNPDGRPKGSRHKATLAAEALLDGEAEVLTRKAI
jgi:hypothetical protein